MNPYNLVVLDKPKNLNAESPSKNCVSGTTLAPASRLNHPLLGIVVASQTHTYAHTNTKVAPYNSRKRKLFSRKGPAKDSFTNSKRSNVVNKPVKLVLVDS